MTIESFRILLADDDATVRLLMHAALLKAGFQVTLACDGEEAVRLFEAAPADMVMLDVEMPGMDGYQVCSYLRTKIGNELPIMMVTGMDDMQSIDRAFEAGATDFIAKPINWNLIAYRILYLRRGYLNMLALKAANARNKAIFSAIPDTMFILNGKAEVIDICSYSDSTPWLKANAENALTQSLPGDIAKLYLEAADRARHQGTVESFEYPLTLANKKTRYYENRVAVIDAQETLCLVRDITERKDSESKIFHLAYFDNLTGLPNRQSFMERLESEIKRAKYTGNKLAVLFLDLDGFKSINDTMGHTTGDTVLQSTADIALTLQAEKRMHLENDLRDALEKQEFFLVYQPQFDIAAESFQSVEALIRWNHPRQGSISPLDFIPLAEENGLIIPIGEWVLRTACQDAARWHQQGHCLEVAVNLSPLQIKNPGLVRSVLDILAETNFPPEKLVLEITEGALMEHNENTLSTLQALRNHNIQIALDDFGTGYSSMNYLKRLPINNLKVDQSFIHGLLDDDDNLAIVRAIISLSKNLGFTVTAEGIETLEQAQVLKHFGCETLQGFYFSKPIEKNEILAASNKRWSIQPMKPSGITHEDR